MATLNEIFEKIAAAQPLDSEERILWLNFLNQSSSVDAKVGAMAPGQSQVTRLSQITNNAGRLTRGEYISPANMNSPYPENADFTGTVMDEDGIRGINSGKVQFDLRSSTGKAVAAGGLMEIDSEGISYAARGVLSSTLVAEDTFYIGGLAIGSSNRFGIHSISKNGGEKIVNGSFETGDFTGWTISGSPAISTDTPSGFYGARITATDYISQTFSTTANSIYVVSIMSKKTATLSGSGWTYPGDVSEGIYPGISGSNSSWSRQIGFLRASGTSATINFKAAATDAIVDNISIYEVFSYSYLGAIYDGTGAMKMAASGTIELSAPTTNLRYPARFFHATTPSTNAFIDGVVALYPKSDDAFYTKVIDTGVEKRILTTDDIYTHPNHTGDVTSVADGATTIGAQKVGISKMLVTAASRLLGRVSAGSGAAEELTVGGGLEFSGSQLRTAAFTGDVTKSAGGTAQTIANDAVTNAKLANMAANTIKGRITASTGDPEDLTAAQVASMLPYDGNDWTPSFTTSGSMTFTSITVTYARYVTVGKICSFTIRATGTVGGTVSGYIYATTPVSTKNLSSTIAAAASVFDTVGNSVGRGFVIMDGTNRLGVAKQVSGYDGNFTAGSTTILISGQFELP